MALPRHVGLDAFYDEEVGKVRANGLVSEETLTPEECREISEHFSELADHAEAQQE